MYINPINEIYKDMEVRINQELEETIVKAVRECDIEVDKGELIKALQYDRNQYEKGFTDAIDKIRAEIEKQEKWLLQAGYNAYNVDIAFSAIKSVLAESEVRDADSN